MATWPLLCRGMPYGIVAYRQDKVTHTRFRLIGLTSAQSAFRPFRHSPASRVSAPFGFPASRPFGFPAFRLTGFSGKEADNVVGRRARFAVTLNPV